MVNLKKQKGFTLIEMMIVVAIIGILVAIALPEYQDYTVRTKVKEGMNLASSAKLAVSEIVQSTGVMPTTNIEAGVPQPASFESKYVESITIGAAGVITVDYDETTDLPEVEGEDVVVLVPHTDVEGRIEWTCGAGGGTTVNTRYLPAECRTDTVN